MDIPRELIDQFVRVTNAAEPLANQLLLDSGLDLDAAISSFFAIQEAGGVPDVLPDNAPPPPPPPVQTPSARHAPMPPTTAPDPDADAALARAIADSEGNRGAVPMDVADDGVRAPIPQRVDTLIPGMAPRRSQAVFDPFAAPAAAGRSNAFSTMFRPPAHLVFPGALDDAMATGRGLRRWVIVAIHRADEFACQVLNRDVWSDPEVQQLLEHSFIFWQRNASSDDGRRYQQFYRYDRDPHVAIIDPRSGERVVVWSPPQYNLDRDEVLRNLTEFVATQSLENASPRRRGPHAAAASAAAPAASVRTAADDADLAETEDAQLAAAIAASMAYADGAEDAEDTDAPAAETNGLAASYAAVAGGAEDLDAVPNALRDLSRQRSATNPTLNRDRSLRAQQDSEYEASLALDRAKAESAREEQERVRRSEQRRDAKRARVPSEPPAGAPGTAELVVRLPDGKRLQRRFRATDAIGAVYDFVDVQAEGVPEGEYDLMTPYPRKTLGARDVTIEQAGLCPKAVLVAHIR